MKNNKGFSLVELIVVIAIMAILASVAVVSYSVYIDRANEAVDREYISSVIYRVKLFALEYGIGVEEIVIAPEVDGPEDIQLIIGWKENGDPIYYEDYTDENRNEIYDSVGNHVMSGDHSNYDPNVSIKPIVPPTGGGDEGGDEHVHDYTEASRVDSTCVTPGTVTYKCGCTEQLALGKHNLQLADSFETFELYECTVCGHNVIKNSGGNAVAPIQ